MSLSSSLKTSWSERLWAGARFSSAEIEEIIHKNDILDLGQLASIVRKRLHGNLASYVVNLHINISNICVNRCRFCSFYRKPGQEGAFALSAEDVWEYARQNAPEGVTEFHLVGGLNPQMDLDFYCHVLAGLRERFPKVHLKGFTAVEIDFLARQSGLLIEKVLERLCEAGLNSLTGGGAETLSPRVREILCPEKLDGEGYLDIHRRAHRMGIPSTATLLFGHVETREERIEHLLKIRELQDETGGFTAFVPLVFHPAHNEMSHLKRVEAREILETIALSRLVLDNIPHIKAYWVSLGLKLAQVALHWGADDLDGTVAYERIHHDAGAKSPRGVSAQELRWLIEEAGFVPQERNSPNHIIVNPVRGLLYKMVNEKCDGNPDRLNSPEAEALLYEGDLLELGQVANVVRWRMHPEPLVTYNIDRNINTTNICESLCGFCAFAKPVGSGAGWILSRDQISEKIGELYSRGGCQILMQGGMNPQTDLQWYLDLFQWMRSQWPDLHIHALSPPEIIYLSQQAKCSIAETIDRLREAGLDSIPGGGAEILADETRNRVSPSKYTADEWIEVMRQAHLQGMKTTVTMVIGLGETLHERIEHLERIRSLQDETGGFTAFILWTFQPGGTALEKERLTGGAKTKYGAGATDYLTTLAVARLYLDNVPNIQASWVTQGRDIAQLALLFGANDLGSTMLEENVVAAAGTRFKMDENDFRELAEDLELKTIKRDFYYRIKA